jgi:dihydropteroate synthase
MRLRDRDFDLRKPLLVGIVNLTPDSFSDGGQIQTQDDLLRRAEQLVRDGADLLDLGGESTRPNAPPVTAEEEAERVLPAIAAIAQRLDVAISVDTRRAAIAHEALQRGAAMVNDVSGFGDPEMGEVVARAGAAWVLMHMPHAVGAMAWSQKVAALPEDPDAAVGQIAADLAAAVARAERAGVARTQLAIDPGIGFGKSLRQNLALLRRCDGLLQLGLPLYLGPSRKSFLGAITGAPVDDRLGATAAAVTAAVLAGAAFVRVHDVRVMRQVLDVATAIRDAAPAAL